MSGIKKCPIFLKVAQKVVTAVFASKVLFAKIVHKITKCLGCFVSKFIAKIFKIAHSGHNQGDQTARLFFKNMKILPKKVQMQEKFKKTLKCLLEIINQWPKWQCFAKWSQCIKSIKLTSNRSPKFRQKTKSELELKC